ncbi:MAG: hypothetical protein ACTHU0_21425, partial [Kofleriaceae bacterium]
MKYVYAVIFCATTLFVGFDVGAWADYDYGNRKEPLPAPYAGEAGYEWWNCRARKPGTGAPWCRVNASSRNQATVYCGSWWGGVSTNPSHGWTIQCERESTHPLQTSICIGWGERFGASDLARSEAVEAIAFSYEGALED